ETSSFPFSSPEPLASRHKFWCIFLSVGLSILYAQDRMRGLRVSVGFVNFSSNKLFLVQRCVRRSFIRGISYKSSERRTNVGILFVHSVRNNVVIWIFLSIFSFIFMSINSIWNSVTTRVDNANKCIPVSV